jgi:hypothetical protein
MEVTAVMQRIDEEICDVEQVGFKGRVLGGAAI